MEYLRWTRSRADLVVQLLVFNLSPVLDMVLAYSLVLALSALSAQAASVSDACKQIAAAISNSSDVYYPG